MSDPNRTSVPELLRDTASALEEACNIIEATPGVGSARGIANQRKRATALRALADRFEKPTEAMVYAGAAAIEHLIDNFPGVDTAFCEAVAHAAIIAAIAAAGEGL